MADFGLNEYSADAEDIARRRRYAEMLQQQAMQPLETQTAGGWAIPTSPLSGVAKLLQAYQGRKGLEEASSRQKALGERLRGDASNWVGAMPQPTTVDMNLVAKDDEGNAMPAANVTKQPGQNEMLAWMLRGSQNPMTAPMVGPMMQMTQARETREDNQAFRTSEAEANRQFRAQEAQAAREARAAEIQQRLADARTTAQEQAALRRELAQMSIAARQDMAKLAASLRPEPQPQVVTNDQGVFQVGRDGTAKQVIGPGGQPISGKKAPASLPASALKMQQELVDEMTTAKNIEKDLSVLDNQIAEGKLKIGPVNNVVSSVQNTLGLSSPQSRNFASFKATLEKLRNDSLRLNKGVQTEGDAQRAWNELFNSINDPQVVQQRLAEIRAINARAADQKRMQVDAIRANFGAGPYEQGGLANPPAAVGARPGADAAAPKFLGFE